MSKIVKILTCIIVLALSGCSSGQFYTNSQNTLKDLKGIKSFRINELKIPFRPTAESELITLNMKEALTKELKTIGLKENFDNPDLIIDGELNYFDKGDAALRYFLGAYGAGKAKVKFNFTFTSKRTSKPIIGFGEGTLQMGSFGGDVKIMTTKIAKNIINQINN